MIVGQLDKIAYGFYNYRIVESWSSSKMKYNEELNTRCER